MNSALKCQTFIFDRLFLRTPHTTMCWGFTMHIIGVNTAVLAYTVCRLRSAISMLEIQSGRFRSPGSGLQRPLWTIWGKSVNDRKRYFTGNQLMVLSINCRSQLASAALYTQLFSSLNGRESLCSICLPTPRRRRSSSRQLASLVALWHVGSLLNWRGDEREVVQRPIMCRQILIESRIPL